MDARLCSHPIDLLYTAALLVIVGIRTPTIYLQFPLVNPDSVSLTNNTVRLLNLKTVVLENLFHSLLEGEI